MKTFIEVIRNEFRGIVGDISIEEIMRNKSLIEKVENVENYLKSLKGEMYDLSL